MKMYVGMLNFVSIVKKGFSSQHRHQTHDVQPMDKKNNVHNVLFSSELRNIWFHNMEVSLLVLKF